MMSTASTESHPGHVWRRLSQRGPCGRDLEAGRGKGAHLEHGLELRAQDIGGRSALTTAVEQTLHIAAFVILVGASAARAAEVVRTEADRGLHFLRHLHQ